MGLYKPSRLLDCERTEQGRKGGKEEEKEGGEWRRERLASVMRGVIVRKSEMRVLHSVCPTNSPALPLLLN